MTELDLTTLRRSPDVEAGNLYAWDAADTYLLEWSRSAVAAADPGTIAVIGDHYGALTLSLISDGCRALKVHQDGLSGELALARNAALLSLPPSFTHYEAGPDLLSGVRLVLMRLPRSLPALEELCWLIARYADPDVVVMAAGRVKHMSLGMNDVLAKYFGSVQASLAQRKSRILTASGPRAIEAPPFPVSAEHDVGAAAPLVLWSHGAAFGGAKLDPGTRFLLPHLRNVPQLDTAVDLGCGTGAIAAYLALERPDIAVLATDQSAAAVASARLTAQANGVSDQVQVLRDDALSSRPDGSERLIVVNPPFHTGSSVHSGIALKLFREAARVLLPGGELWAVWNSHLMYAPALNRIVGRTRQVDRNPKFTVSVSTRRS